MIFNIDLRINEVSREDINQLLECINYYKLGKSHSLLVTPINKKQVTSETIFKGEIKSVDIISYKELSERLCVTDGILNLVDHGWLKFQLDGKTLLVSKQNVRNHISWDYLNQLGVVFGNHKVPILINGRYYKCRLLTGADGDPYPRPSNVNYPEGSHDSEFSRLFYPLVTDDAYVNSYYTGPKLAEYTTAELNIGTGNGRYMWCQETRASNTAYRVVRGSHSASYLYSASSSSLNGWRPVLELVP